MMSGLTVGQYLATRLHQAGAGHVFAVAGDYNLVLLDEMNKVERPGAKSPFLEQRYCTNELNCGFAAEGYARARGLGCAVVTFSVGAISAFNALGGAFAEDLAMVLVSGAPNTNDIGTGHVLHHSLGTADTTYQFEIAKKLTCAAVVLSTAASAPQLIDFAICEALRKQKPVFIEIPCNLAAAQCAVPGPKSGMVTKNVSDHETLEMAVEEARKWVAQLKKPIMMIGPKVRSARAEQEAVLLADTLGCAVVVMAAAKGLFPETHPQYAGVYWGSVSQESTRTIVDWTDGVVCIGAVFSDYSTVGWSAAPPGEGSVFVDPERVQFGSFSFGPIFMRHFLARLASVILEKRPATMLELERIQRPSHHVLEVADPEARLSRTELFRQVRGVIEPQSTVFTETGECWFSSMELPLPQGARFEIEMQWGHIGWSVPACFGYAVGAPDRRVIGLIGDGSFQVTAQALAQMIRYKLPVIIFLVNNRGYAIESAIHEGPYNEVKNWDYAGLVNVFNAADGEGLGVRAANGHELQKAIELAVGHREGPTLIECAIDKDDCSASLISWGTWVTKANTKPPLTRQ
jgi:pyruvate decarboxylase